MRLSRFALSLLVASTLLVPAAHGAPSIRQLHLAFAEFNGPKIDRNHWKWYGALVLESVDVTGETKRFGGVFKGTCSRQRGENSTRTTCSGRGAGMSPHDTFTIEPAASAASLDVHNESGHHHVEWVASDDDRPFPFTFESQCNDGVGFGGGIVRLAVADGHVYGHHFRTKPSFAHFNELWSGASVTQCGFLSRRDLRDLLDGGGFSIHRGWAPP
jgi:hypothetical protein